MIWFRPWLSDRTGLTIMCQYSKSLLFNRRALFPGILQSPLIHWPFPWKHSSLVTLTDEQCDPLTSNLFMLMVLTLLIVSQAPHSCLISSVDLYLPEILSISSPSDSITFSSIQQELSLFFFTYCFSKPLDSPPPPLTFLGLSFSYLQLVCLRGLFSEQGTTLAGRNPHQLW